MDQSLKKILHKIWDKYQVYDEKLIRKFLTGFKELDSIELRNEFRNWFGGDDAVFNKVEEFLSKPKHARVGGYDFDYKPIIWDINVSKNRDMWVELDSSVVDANGKVTLDGYDGNTYDIGEVMDGEEFSGEDNMAWEVNDEINDIIRLQLKDLLIKNFGIDLVYYNNLVYDDQAFEKSLKESIRRILKEETEPISNDMGEKYYISWDENYGKSFKLVKTPYGAQSGGKWEPNLVSIVTPENTNAWYEWEELSDEKLDMWKENWDNIQKTLGNHKYNQIIRNM
jgi:hypothetical protein